MEPNLGHLAKIDVNELTKNRTDDWERCLGTVSNLE